MQHILSISAVSLLNVMFTLFQYICGNLFLKYNQRNMFILYMLELHHIYIRDFSNHTVWSVYSLNILYDTFPVMWSGREIFCVSQLESGVVWILYDFRRIKDRTLILLVIVFTTKKSSLPMVPRSTPLASGQWYNCPSVNESTVHRWFVWIR